MWYVVCFWWEHKSVDAKEQYYKSEFHFVGKMTHLIHSMAKISSSLFRDIMYMLDVFKEAAFSPLKQIVLLAYKIAPPPCCMCAHDVHTLCVCLQIMYNNSLFEQQWFASDISRSRKWYSKNWSGVGRSDFVIKAWKSAILYVGYSFPCCTISSADWAGPHGGLAYLFYLLVFPGLHLDSDSR